MTIAGGCLCGAARLESSAPPVLAAFCHCSSCRRHTGAPVAAYADFARAHFRFVQGAPARYASSPGVVRGVCAACGSTLSYEGEDLPAPIHIHLGALDNPEDFPPSEPSSPEAQLRWLSVSVQRAKNSRHAAGPGRFSKTFQSFHPTYAASLSEDSSP